MAGTKKTTDDKNPEVSSKESKYKPAGLIYLGVIVLILGILSATPLVARTILSVPADFMVVVGLIAIVVGLIIRGRQ